MYCLPNRHIRTRRHGLGGRLRVSASRCISVSMLTDIFPGDLKQVKALDHHWPWEQCPLGRLVKSGKTQVKSFPKAGFAGPPPQEALARACLILPHTNSSLCSRTSDTSSTSGFPELLSVFIDWELESHQMC